MRRRGQTLRRIARPAMLGAIAVTTSAAECRAQAWRQYQHPAAAGWNVEQLSKARRLADSLGSTAVMVVHGGNVVAAWGEVSTPLAVASVRKSLMATLFGAEWRHGGLSLADRLGTLGIQELQPLDAREATATVRDVLAARSGVYRPAAQEPEAWAQSRPAAGTDAPGTRWFYNNWSFNVMGTIYETWRHRSVYQGFLEAVARPIGMEDYTGEANSLRFRTPTRSMHPAHSFLMSARDLARVGELHVRKGRWGRLQVLAPGWTDSVRNLHTRSTDPAEGWSSPVDGYGYGWLWWVNPGRSRDWGVHPALAAVDHLAAIGAGAQLVFVAPEAQLVIVHLADRTAGAQLEEAVAFRVAEVIVGAAPKRTLARAPRTVAMQATAFTGRAPRPAMPAVVAAPIEDLRQLEGEYDAGRGLIIRAFVSDGALFLSHPRLGENELQRARDRGELFYSVGGGVTAVFADDSTGTKVVTVQAPAGRIVARRVARPSTSARGGVH